MNENIVPELSLDELLAERDARSNLRRSWLGQGAVLLSLQMNIAGPRKRSPLLDAYFERARLRLLERLEGRGASVEEEVKRVGFAGLSAHYRIKEISAYELKQLCMEMEAENPAARLLDLDVWDEQGNALSGFEMGRGRRKCLLCDAEAHVCARSRRHSLDKIWEKSLGLIHDSMLVEEAERLLDLALKAMLYEIVATPKPGLVDCANQGSHQDMDHFLFLKSSLTLREGLQNLARSSLLILQEGLPSMEEWAKRIQALGVEIDHQLLSSTNGVNTQIGLVYAFAILIPSALKLLDQKMREAELENSALIWPSAQEIALEGAKMAKELCKKDLKGTRKPEGARASAVSAYEIVFKDSLIILRKAIEKEYSVNAASQLALLRLMQINQDTNLLRRGGEDGLRSVQKKAGELLDNMQNLDDELELKEKVLNEKMREFDRWMQEKGLSPGGSADLLVLTWFFYFV